MKDLFGREIRGGGGRGRKESAFIVFRKFHGYIDEHKCVSCKKEVCPGRGDRKDRACSQYEEKDGKDTEDSEENQTPVPAARDV